jgi:outer membrane protein TolC
MRRTSVLLLALVLLMVLAALPALAATADYEPPQGQVLTLQKAIDLALRYDKNLQKAAAEVERTKELREDAAKKIDFTPAPGSSYEPTTELNWNNLLSADLNWRMSKKNLEATRDALVLKVCQSYWNTQTAQEKVALQEKLEQQALLKLQNARAGAQAGTVSPSQVVLAESQWQQAKNNLEAARHDLEDAYVSLNQLIGLRSEERPLLTDNPAFEPLDVVDLEHEVARVVASSPSVWLAQQTVTLKEWAADMMFFTGQYNPYKARQIAVDQAELDAASAADLMELVTRNLYYAARGLEESYRAATEALQMAQENLRVVQVKYDAGMAIKADIQAAEVAVAQAEQAVNALKRQHAYVKLAFEKPWAASAGSGGTSGAGS